MGFFASMERDLGEEFRDIAEDQEALQARLRSQRKMSGAHQGPHDAGKAEDARGRKCWRQANRKTRSSASLPPACGRVREDTSKGAELYTREWEKHDEAWIEFQSNPPCPLSVDDVPWPPCASDVVNFCEKFHAPGNRRQAYRIACRRWHPDKFLQHYGSLACPAALPSLSLRVNEVFQAVTADWDRSQSKKA
jgi:hypothetical protein